MKEKLNETNCSIIYDQLTRIENDKSPIELARNQIQMSGKTAFESYYFTQISEQTVVDILNMDSLSVAEIELLKAVSNWVDAEVIRLNLFSDAEHKRKVFEPFKRLIKFSDMTAEQIGVGFGKIENLLTIEEISSLFLHLFDKSKPLVIKCATEHRTSTNIYSIFDGQTTNNGYRYSNLLASLIVYKKIYIKSLDTLLPGKFYI